MMEEQLVASLCWDQTPRDEEEWTGFIVVSWIQLESLKYVAAEEATEEETTTEA